MSGCRPLVSILTNFRINVKILKVQKLDILRIFFSKLYWGQTIAMYAAEMKLSIKKETHELRVPCEV
ncbi:MAG: hypothetical protein JWR67_1641 [Mucilaginibacter sp.]|nr:hypothetical protein [Mucilaginibacter sp.]